MPAVIRSSSPWRAAAQAMLVVLALALFVGLGSNAAFAQVCTVSATNINFGDVDLTADTAINITTTLSVSCSGFSGNPKKVRVCPQIGTGTGGAAAAGDPRYLVTATVPQNRLSVSLFSNNTRTSVWGSSTYGWTTVPSDDVSISNAGTGTLSITVYARLLAGQRLSPVGTYTSSLNILMGYAQTNSLTCEAIGTVRSASTTMSVQARVIPRCTVSGTNLLFPATSLLTSARDATGAISAVCTPGAVYNIGLNGGATGATNPTQRQMRNGSASITYGLYSDTGRSAPWGNTFGTNTIQATGSGSTQTLTVYGRVPVQSTPAPGTYSDTITIQVEY